ncbi:hypothetical protein AQUCO_01800121v1 [Aquilegia coerulea]|uniref:Uncharacterized protein n=1 Tax=Aquilegia coerulea TaxID=218851 RepID=A0A2G5DK18_AQUCA|nr:hypothetical protein AQUCO_01800121v1 [Aquilegia coerulea]
MGSSIDQQHNEFDHHQTYDDHHDNVVAVNLMFITNSVVVTEEDRERSEAEKEELSIHDFAISNGFDFDISNGEEEEDISVHDFDTSSGFDFGISNREEENYCTGDHDGYLYSSSSHPWQDEIAALLSAELPPPLCY